MDVSDRSMDDLMEEFLVVRAAFALLFQRVPAEYLAFMGDGVGYKITARALGYIAIGHAKHHLNIIQERYL